MTDIGATVEAVWRIEGSRIVASLARITGDIGLAEDVAQEAFAEALVQWKESGVPQNVGAWLTAVAKRRAIDHWRRMDRRDERCARMASEMVETADTLWEPIDDDVLRLILVACHPVLSREAQIALTLRVVGGLSSEEIARMFLVPVATVQQRIVRAKKTLSAARVPFETPEPSEWRTRLAGVLGVIYLIFTEGYAATAGASVLRHDLADEALRLARRVSALVPREPEALGLVALCEFQASRFRARVDRDGDAILLADQNRSLWDRNHIQRGDHALARVDALGRGRGPYALQAAIAQAHAHASSVETTDWEHIVVLYEALERVAPSPVVTLNRAVAVSMATGPASALRIVDALADSAALRTSVLLPSVRGELLARLGRSDEARVEFELASERSTNLRQRAVFDRKRAELDGTPRGQARPNISCSSGSAVTFSRKRISESKARHASGKRRWN